MFENVDGDIWSKLASEAIGIIGRTNSWHWFSYHFSTTPPNPFALSIVSACAVCEKKLPGLGYQFIREIGAICGREKHEPHYDQLLQKLAEVLILRQLLLLKWPEATTFQHEPAVSATGKRPELQIITPERRFLFEVKTPSLLAHTRNRKTNAFQVAGRVLPIEPLQRFAGEGGLTLPRDNPVKDFLLDANKKFAQFKAGQVCTSILIIVWDDFLYEPITVLKHEQCGLLTANSYHKNEVGQAIQFESIDAVVLVRHLTYFYRAAANIPLEERAHALDFGDMNALPNVFVPISANFVPDLIREGLRAYNWDDPLILKAADYRPKDIVFWI